MELKYGQSADAALLQIEQKNYADALANETRPVVSVGISFSKDERTMTEWTVKVK